jgi:hypothetical protein
MGNKIGHVIDARKCGRRPGFVDVPGNPAHASTLVLWPQRFKDGYEFRAFHSPRDLVAHLPDVLAKLLEAYRLGEQTFHRGSDTLRCR